MNIELFANDFIETFKPDLNRYVAKDSEGILTTVKRPLTNGLIMRFFSDRSSCRLSFFVRGTHRNYFGIDIDDHHDCGGWTGNVPSDFLCKKFAYVKNEIGKDPSMVFRSPRGIHAFWFLTESLPNLVIEDILKVRLYEVEILPTKKHALAIPRPTECLNSSLRPAVFHGYSRVITYDPKDIFGKNSSPDAIKQEYKSGKTAGKTNNGRLFSMKSLEDMEAIYLPIKNGKSNEAYISLVAMYIARGLSTSQAVQRFRVLVAKSSGYSGRLLSNIENRVASSYRNIKGRMSTMEMGSPSVLLEEPKIQRIIKEILNLEGLYSKKRVRMRESHTKFLLLLFSWVRAIDRIQADPEYAAYWGYLYPKSFLFLRDGYFPLPHTLLHKWNSHYNDHLNLLKKYGILVESPHGYSTTLKRCKHYRLTKDISPT